MNIDPKTSLGGIPIVNVRDFLRRHAAYGWRREDAIDAFGSTHADTVVEALISGGYIEWTQEYGSSRYMTTVKGGALTKASAARPVSRKTAEQALKGFLERCHEVGHRPDLLYRVRKALLFGSMLGDKPFVSDVDIAFQLVPKEKDPDRHFALTQEQSQQALREGRRFSNLVEELFYSEYRVRLFLKSRSRVIQLSPIDDAVLERTETKVIFEDTP